MPEGMKEKEMIDLLLKRFVKDYDKMKNPEVRTRYGVFAGIVGIICNLILFLAKILAGVLTASVSIMADAVNNLSDAGSSIVTLIGFKLAGNESYAGDDIEAMNVYFAEKQDGRLVHYESAYYNRAYEDTISDLETRMYAKPEDVEKYLNNSPKKPVKSKFVCKFIFQLCGFIYATFIFKRFD